MNVKIIKTGKVETVSASYGTRLIEQGKAAPVHKPEKKEAQKAAPQTSGSSRRQPQGDTETGQISDKRPGDA